MNELEMFYKMFKNALSESSPAGLCPPSDYNFDCDLEEGWMNIESEDYCLKVTDN